MADATPLPLLDTNKQTFWGRLTPQSIVAKTAQGLACYQCIAEGQNARGTCLLPGRRVFLGRELFEFAAVPHACLPLLLEILYIRSGVLSCMRCFKRSPFPLETSSPAPMPSGFLHSNAPMLGSKSTRHSFMTTSMRSTSAAAIFRAYLAQVDSTSLDRS